MPQIYYDYGGKKRTLGALLFEAIDSYEKYSSFAGIANDFEAQSLSSWINTAFAEGVVLDNSDLLNKLREKEELIAKLAKATKYWKEMAQKHGTDLVYWQGKHDELNKQLKSMFKHGDDLHHE